MLIIMKFIFILTCFLELYPLTRCFALAESDIILNITTTRDTNPAVVLQLHSATFYEITRVFKKWFDAYNTTTHLLYPNLNKWDTAIENDTEIYFAEQLKPLRWYVESLSSLGSLVEDLKWNVTIEAKNTIHSLHKMHKGFSDRTERLKTMGNLITKEFKALRFRLNEMNSTINYKLHDLGETMTKMNCTINNNFKEIKEILLHNKTVSFNMHPC